MFCSKCGKEISNDAVFCQFCGNEFSSSKTTGNKDGVCCPKCGSKNLNSTVENDTHGGGYNFLTGCLFGWIIGPLGYFCGERKIKTTIRTNFLCMDCSHKFREANEFSEEKSRQGTSRIVWSIILILGGLFYITEAEVLFGLMLGAVGIYLAYSGQRLKKESEDIAVNKYNSNCYKE